MAGAYGAMRSAVVPVIAGLYGVKKAGDAVLDLFETFAQREKLTLGLQSVEGSAEAAKKRLNELREIAEKPGLDFKGAVGTDLRLQSAGLGKDLSADAITEFGNALALVGGSSDDLKGVGLALGQIASKGKVSAEEINQIAERLPQIRVAMQKAFGTANTEVLQKMGIDSKTFIAGIVGAMKELPRATGGAADSMLKARDAWDDFKATLGGLIAIPGVPMLKDAAAALKDLKNVVDGVDGSGGTALEWLAYNSGAANIPRAIDAIVQRIKYGADAQGEMNALTDAALERQKERRVEEERILQLRESELATYYFWQGLDEENRCGEGNPAAS